MNRLLVICFMFVLGIATLGAQEKAPVRVSVLGEDEAAMTALSDAHPEMLLSVWSNDMDLAYEKWMEMLGAMEDYADEIEYDIKGLKTYMQVYWSKDGEIDHLAFYPKPNSRNIPIAELRAFFKGFVKTYHMQINTEQGFSHYATASFPLHARPEYSVDKND